MNNKAIGVFDSGLGGLTVVKEIKKVLSHEDIIYLGDTARVPYGTRSKETIIKFSFQDASFLLKNKVKCIIVACNTASANASEELRNKLPVPVLDVIDPGVCGAVRSTRNKRIGVIGTRGTILSHAYKKGIKKIDNSIEVFEESIPLFVPFIEEGEISGKLITLLIKNSLSSLKNKKIDTLVLGCTHYPIIEKGIAKELNMVRLVNPGVELAKRLKTFLGEKKLETSRKRKGKVSFYVTDLTSRFINVASMFLGEKIKSKISKINLE